MGIHQLLDKGCIHYYHITVINLLIIPWTYSVFLQCACHTHHYCCNHWKDTTGPRECKVTLIKTDRNISLKITETDGEISLKKEITYYTLAQGVISQSPSFPQKQAAINDTTALNEDGWKYEKFPFLFLWGFVTSKCLPTILYTWLSSRLPTRYKKLELGTVPDSTNIDLSIMWV